jgi:hypothetical protein
MEIIAEGGLSGEDGKMAIGSKYWTSEDRHI